jgi:hypothetical protein
MVIIYGLECIRNGKVYVGCTEAKWGKRMREHRCLLRAGKHSEPELQADFNRYGGSAFEMIPLLVVNEEIDVGTKRALEKRWMEHYAIRGLLYNSRRCSFEPPEGAQALAVKKRVENGYKPSEESNEKRRLAQIGKPKGHGAKISATKQAKRLMR